MDKVAHQLSSEEILNVLSVSKNATAIYVTDDIIIQMANDAMIRFWGKDKTIIGKPLIEAVPELQGQPFVEMLQKVLREGITISGSDTPAELKIDGRLQTFYFDFEYRAIKNAEGDTYCILHTATDVTERVHGKLREIGLTEELSAINEELTASNEELITANDELSQSQIQLRHIYEELKDNDTRFRNMVKQAPIGICIIRAEDLMILDVNDSYLELVGKKRSELENKTIWKAVPEAAESYKPIMDKVISTGNSFHAKEHQVVLIRNGVAEMVFVDFVYEPVRSSDVTISAIMVLAIEVTDKVLARRSIEEMEERARMAVAAADMGTFDLDIENDVVQTSDRFKAIFNMEQPLTRDVVNMIIHPDDRALRLAAIDEAYKNGQLFYEARIINSDNSIRWIRAQGKVIFNDDKKPVRLLGTILDISEFRQLQQQKDDFISIASHELKTPLTSLKASLQLLERMKDKPSSMLPLLIDQCNKSMDKISALVEDLLNVSRTNTSQLQLDKTIFTMAELLETCCNHVRVAGKYTLTIEGDRHLQVYADEHGVDQVVVNLVNNAVKYAPDSVEIFLIIEQTAEMARISVKDLGPGIPPDKLSHLFDRYYQVNASGFKSSGLGLGLYISAEIIRRHGGEMGVTSELGKGSTFWFTLPLAEAEKNSV